MGAIAIPWVYRSIEREKSLYKIEGGSHTSVDRDAGTLDSSTAAWNLLDPNLSVSGVLLIHNPAGTARLSIDH
jgi:hypothetical protein